MRQRKKSESAPPMSEEDTKRKLFVIEARKLISVTTLAQHTYNLYSNFFIVCLVMMSQ